MSSKVDPEFYAEDETERYSEEIYLEEKTLKTDLTKDSKTCHPTCDEQFPVLGEKQINDRLIEQ